MSTRSSIAYVNAEGKVKSVYCHFDGYPEGVGLCLVLAHNNEEDAKHIVELGDLSILDRYLEPKGDKHSFDSREEEVSVFYGRDRGETGIEAKDWECLDDWLEMAWDIYDAEYCYYWKDNKWNCVDTGFGDVTDLYELAEIKTNGVEDKNETEKKMRVKLVLPNISAKEFDELVEYLDDNDIYFEQL